MVVLRSLGFLCSFAGASFAFAPRSCALFQKAGPMKQQESAAVVVAVAAVATTEPQQQWDVERYQSQHSFVWENGSPLIDIVLEHVDAAYSAAPERKEETPLRILDVGCGSGELTWELANKLKYAQCIVHGMDSDANMVQSASAQFPNLNFFQDDVRTMNGLDNAYDILFSNAALHWVPPRDAEDAVKALAKALRPGGQLVVEFGGKGNVQSIVQGTQMAIQELGLSKNDDDDDSEPFWYFPSVSEFSSLLERHGIEVTSASLYDRPTPLQEGEEGLANWLRMFGSHFFKGLDQQETESVLRKVDKSLRNSHLWNGEHWTADYRRIRMTGVKTTTATNPDEQR